MIKLREVEGIIKDAYANTSMFENIIEALERNKVILNYDYNFFEDIFVTKGIDALIIEVYKSYQEKDEKVNYDSLHMDNDMPYRWVYKDINNQRIYELWVKLHLSAHSLNKTICSEFYSLKSFYDWIQTQDNYDAYLDSPDELWILQCNYSIINLDNTTLAIYEPPKENIITSVIGVPINAPLPCYLFETLDDAKSKGFMPKFVKECIDKKRKQYAGYKWYNVEIRKL